MVAVMTVTVIGPFFYGHAKAKLAPKLHNKVLYADADMAKADWTSTAASIVGVLGVGVGLWWLDGAAALFISIGIVWDGWRNSRAAVLDLIDQRARTEDDARPHPLITRIANRVEELPWVREAAVRMRDMGQVFHVEVFVVPTHDDVRLGEIEEAREAVAALDWKVQDVVVIPTSTLPDEAEPAGERRSHRDA
jgi:divalent metal cation (Fe/Co/Zn/Cd) transporter